MPGSESSRGRVIGSLDLPEAGRPVSALADRSAAVVYRAAIIKRYCDLRDRDLRHGLRFDKGRVRNSGSLGTAERWTRAVNILNLDPSPASDYRIKARA